MKCFALVGVFLLTGFAPLAAAEKEAEGFVPLFNGRDLAGWVNVNCAPSTFFVKDGEIVTTGRPTGFMRTDRQYENFVLEMDWMHVNTKEVGNSGLFVWGDPVPATGTGYTRGIEVQVLVNLEYKDKKTGAVTATSHGDLFSIWGATCKPDRPHPLGWARCLPSEYRAKGGGEWNHYKVTANNGIIKLEVNGKEVSGVSECKPRKGYLALESEGAECHFKNIRIKELPSTNPPPDEVADVDQGFKSLYTGLDLTHWQADAEDKKHWQPRDWTLHYDGKGDKELLSSDAFGDYELIVDWKTPPASGKKGGDRVGIVLRGAKQDQLALGFTPDGQLEVRSVAQQANSDASIPLRARVKEMKPTGQWNRTAVTLKGKELAATLNGKVVLTGVQLAKAPAKGPIGLGADGPADFANVFIRPLKKNDR